MATKKINRRIKKIKRKTRRPKRKTRQTRRNIKHLKGAGVVSGALSNVQNATNEINATTQKAINDLHSNTNIAINKAAQAVEENKSKLTNSMNAASIKACEGLQRAKDGFNRGISSV